MNREEIDNLLTDFDEMGFCPTTLVKNPEAYAIQWRNNMRDAIIKHEQATLKEFVGYIKDRLNILIKDQHCAAEIAKAESDSYRATMSFLMADTIEVIKNSISQNLENFLNERGEL